jgi:hypothetical protein
LCILVAVIVSTEEDKADARLYALVFRNWGRRYIGTVAASLEAGMI